MGSGERVSYEPQYQTGLTEFGAKCSQGCYTIRKLDRASSNRFADRPPGTSELGRVSRVSPVQTALRNCTRDEGGPFGFGEQELIPSYRKLLWSKAMVVSVAERRDDDPGKQG